jgi:hypothetical protein
VEASTKGGGDIIKQSQALQTLLAG